MKIGNKNKTKTLFQLFIEINLEAGKFNTEIGLYIPLQNKIFFLNLY